MFKKSSKVEEKPAAALGYSLALADHSPAWADLLQRLATLEAREADLVAQYAEAERAPTVETANVQEIERERRARALLGEELPEIKPAAERISEMERITQDMQATRHAIGLLRDRERQIRADASRAVCSVIRDDFKGRAADAARAAGAALDALNHYLALAREMNRQGVLHGQLGPLPLDVVMGLAGQNGTLRELVREAAAEGYAKAK